MANEASHNSNLNLNEWRETSPMNDKGTPHNSPEVLSPEALAKARPMNHLEETANSPGFKVVKEKIANDIDKNGDGTVSKGEATEYAKTVKVEMARAPQELKAAINEAPELTPEKTAANFKHHTGKDISPEAAEILAKATREGAAAPNPTGNANGGGNAENGQDGKSRGLPGEKKDEKEAGTKSGFMEQIGKFITMILSMMGLNDEEKNHAKNDMEGKSAASGGKTPTSNEAAATAQKVTGREADNLNNVKTLSKSVLDEAMVLGKQAQGTGGREVNFEAANPNALRVAMKNEAGAAVPSH